MTIYLLKAYEPSPDLYHPDVTRRDQEPLPFDRIKVTVHQTLEAAPAAAQASYDETYDNHPIPGLNPDYDDNPSNVLRFTT